MDQLRPLLFHDGLRSLSLCIPCSISISLDDARELAKALPFLEKLEFHMLSHSSVTLDCLLIIAGECQLLTHIITPIACSMQLTSTISPLPTQPSLKHLHLAIRDSSNITALCQSLENCFSFLTMLRLEESRDTSRTDSLITWSILRPLIQLTNLTVLEIRLKSYAFELTDGDIKEIGRALPHLTYLTIRGQWRLKRDPSRPPVTFSGILALVDLCSNLGEVTIHANVSSTFFQMTLGQRIELRCGIPRNTSLKFLDVLETYVPSGDILDFSILLAVSFASLDFFRMNGTAYGRGNGSIGKPLAVLRQAEKHCNFSRMSADELRQIVGSSNTDVNIRVKFLITWFSLLRGSTSMALAGILDLEAELRFDFVKESEANSYSKNVLGKFLDSEVYLGLPARTLDSVEGGSRIDFNLAPFDDGDSDEEWCSVGSEEKISISELESELLKRDIHVSEIMPYERKTDHHQDLDQPQILSPHRRHDRINPRIHDRTQHALRPPPPPTLPSLRKLYTREVITEREIADTYCSAKFDTVQYGTYKARPAALIIMTYTFHASNPSLHRFRRATIDVKFSVIHPPYSGALPTPGKEQECPPTSAVEVLGYAPRGLYGEVSFSQMTKERGISAPIQGGPSFLSLSIQPKVSYKEEAKKGSCLVIEGSERGYPPTRVVWSAVENEHYPDGLAGIPSWIRTAVIVGIEEGCAQFQANIRLDTSVGFTVDPRRWCPLLAKRDDPVHFNTAKPLMRTHEVLGPSFDGLDLVAMLEIEMGGTIRSIRK
ncbi:hypothetical protein CONPUDRAFT_147776 [Coniophora puteana RWD-64-598 SS2]|uniref:Uncharacterized protein n=1 Tax=Coniophora puteana (strain RWD-64-598) TaxID=741705 RepID=R7SHA6_CONPW|nr:uncharacterized protein CONPUDRAFT_147776 [Coniophora puteana RWD-64-598 SS2]EIW74454.1 hypothetical protein CONPUDRAFT_147776 [Coniophora puteana RWD-64-598 SS2]